MEVLRILKVLNYKPKRTIRVVLFANEENGLRGGKKYAELAKINKESHFFALESDAGGFTPRAFSFDTTESEFESLKKYKGYLNNMELIILLWKEWCRYRALKG